MAQKALLACAIAILCLQQGDATAATKAALEQVKTSLGLVDTNAAIYVTALNKAEVIAKIPEKVNKARTCVLNAVPIIKAGVSTIGIIPTFTVAATRTKSALDTGKSLFETGTKAVPKAKEAADKVAPKVTTLKNSIVKFKGLVTTFTATLTTSQDLLDQIDALMGFGATFGSGTAMMDSTMTTGKEELRNIVLGVMMKHVNSWFDFAQLTAIVKKAEIDSKPWETNGTNMMMARIQKAGQATLTASIGAAVEKVYALDTMKTALKTAVEKRMKAILRAIVRFFGRMKNTPPNDLAKELIKEILAEPIKAAVTSAVASVTKEVDELFDTSATKVTAIKASLAAMKPPVTLDVDAIAAATKTATAAEGAKFQTDTKAVITAKFSEKVTEFAYASLKWAIEECMVHEGAASTCIKSGMKVKAKVTFDKFKAEVYTEITKMAKDLAGNVGTKVATDLKIADKTKVAEIMNLMAGVTVDTVDLSMWGTLVGDAANAKLIKACDRAMTQAILEVQNTPSGAALVTGAKIAQKVFSAKKTGMWKEALVQGMKEIMGESVLATLKTAIDAVSVDAMKLFTTSILDLAKAEFEKYLIEEKVAAVKAKELATEAGTLMMKTWNTVSRMDEKSLQLKNEVVEKTIAWAYEFPQDLITKIVAKGHSFNLDAKMSAGVKVMNDLNAAALKLSDPVTTQTAALEKVTTSKAVTDFETASTDATSKVDGLCKAVEPFQLAVAEVLKYLEKSYCLDTVVNALPGCVGGQSYFSGAVTLPTVCPSAYVKKSQYCMIPANLLKMTMCIDMSAGDVRLGSSFTGYVTLCGKVECKPCVSAATLQNLAKTAVDAAIKALGFKWDLPFDLSAAGLMPEFPAFDLDGLIAAGFGALPTQKVPGIRANTDGSFFVQGWTDEAINIITQKAVKVIEAIKRKIKTAVKLSRVQDPSAMMNDADFKAGLEKGYATISKVTKDQVSVALAIARRLADGAERNLATGDMTATFTVTIPDDDYDAPSAETIKANIAATDTTAMATALSTGVMEAKGFNVAVAKIEETVIAAEVPAGSGYEELPLTEGGPPNTAAPNAGGTDAGPTTAGVTTAGATTAGAAAAAATGGAAPPAAGTTSGAGRGTGPKIILGALAALMLTFTS